MNVLILGSGGREHAIAWKIAKSSYIDNLYIAPGNAGTKNEGINVDIAVDDFETIGQFCIDNKIEIMVVGPELPLVKGIRDYFEQNPFLRKVGIIGPNKKGAMLEGSKKFAKEFMEKHNIPTAKYKSFNQSNYKDAFTFIDELKPPYVLKADGLAAGKGVLIINDAAEAKQAVKEMIVDGKFGDASKELVIEEFLKGIELSTFVLTDGNSYKILPEAKDYKRIGDGDTGLNTGGMGAISPVPFADQYFMKKVENQIVIPTIHGLKQEGIDYKGFIFIGLMNVKGSPYVIEYNVRMGDPETEVVIPRVKSDLLDLFEGVITETLSERDLEVDDRTTSTVMIVSGGYPEDYQKGKVISGVSQSSTSIPFHAGTKMEGGQLKTDGGRVMAVTSYGRTIEDAVSRSYNAVKNISFDDMYYRKDIGFDLREETV